MTSSGVKKAPFVCTSRVNSESKNRLYTSLPLQLLRYYVEQHLVPHQTEWKPMPPYLNYVSSDQGLALALFAWIDAQISAACWTEMLNRFPAPIEVPLSVAPHTCTDASTKDGPRLPSLLI